PTTEAAPASMAPTAPPAPAAPAVQAPAPTNPEPAAAAPKPVPAPAPTPVADLLHGQQIYRQACAFCHDRGVAGAPKTGDAAAWTARLAQGTDTLYAVAVRGKGAMPAKGGNPALSEADVKAAVDFMLAQSR
ncbi:MAG: c-type cytochrome, partial [Pseudomonadota bacterium]